jgi:hypothetical protein
MLQEFNKEKIQEKQRTKQKENKTKSTNYTRVRIHWSKGVEKSWIDSMGEQ